MDIIDISQNFFQAEGYPGDPVPRRKWISRMEEGDAYTLSSVEACVHTATHIDAPQHVIEGGASVEQMDLEAFYGSCSVVTAQGGLGKEWAEELCSRVSCRILIHGEGNAFLSEEAACFLASYGVKLVGTDASSVGNGDGEIGVHRALLSAGTAVLEGLRLTEAPDGEYLLCSFPIKLDGAEGAPVRAVLIKKEERRGTLPGTAMTVK